MVLGKPSSRSVERRKIQVLPFPSRGRSSSAFAFHGSRSNSIETAPAFVRSVAAAVAAVFLLLLHFFFLFSTARHILFGNEFSIAPVFVLLQ